ncbi:MAG: tetratricopeptide repeat protein [Thermoanaerobaculia bacterium]
MLTLDESRLNDLKQRWARDPGSRLYLQLADEHRKLGQLGEAESVLVKGLENRPSDLSGLVALGRVELELHKVDKALAALDTVVGRDPAHIVANKLLLEVHLQRGDAAKAGERVEICRLLNDRDPELEHLEYRLRQLRAVSQEADAPAEEAFPAEMPGTELPELEVSELEAVEPEAPEMPPPSSEPVARPPAAPLPSNGDEIFHFGGGPPARPSLDSLWTSPSSSEPFGGLVPAFRFADGDVFRLPPPVSRTEPSLQAEPVRETELPVPDALEELTKPVAIRRTPRQDTAAGEPVIYEELTEAAIEDDVLLDTQRTRFTPPKFTLDETEPIPDDVRRAAMDMDLDAPTRKVETMEPTEEPAPAVAEVAPAASAPATRELTTLERAAPEPVAEDEEVATVALGGLYLKQGHIEEAARIFNKVLGRDPSNHAALAGLNRARKPKRGERLTAMDLLADRSLSGTIPAGLTAKKLLVLTNYLGQIRAGRNQDDVR